MPSQEAKDDDAQKLRGELVRKARQANAKISASLAKFLRDTE